MSRVLTILEVSQKQAYIFSSNALADNIQRSGEIAAITSASYLQKATGEQVSISEHMVYSGGGHAILEFEDLESAKDVVRRVTGSVMRDLPGIDLFAVSIRYNEEETPEKNINALTTALEKKKSFRLSSFHQGSFGIEEIDRITGKPVPASRTPFPLCGEEEPPKAGILLTSEFEKLGGTAGDKNFIAVVHIDGNAMGKRVGTISGEFAIGQWDAYKEKIKQFSEAVDHDFKPAYLEMRNEIADALMDSISDPDSSLSTLSPCKKDGAVYLPVRRIIAEGDDICFVSEGRIGVECAAVFLKKLAAKTNAVDGKPYAACAGVALVHTKYPFYRAYELAEELCSNAKKYGATLGTLAYGEEKGMDAGAEISSVDWHAEFGEIHGSLETLRNQYISRDGTHLELRPYIVDCPGWVLEIEKFRYYSSFRKLMKSFADRKNTYSAGRLKELRAVMKKGTIETDNYLRFHRIEDLTRDAYQDIYVDVDYSNLKIGSGNGLERKIFAQTADGKKRSLLFDAVEMTDLFLPVELASDGLEGDRI